MTAPQVPFETEMVHLIRIAKLYKLDLAPAKEKYDDNGEHGAVENDIILDMCYAIHLWQTKGEQTDTMKNSILYALDNWGYEPDEIKKAMQELKWEES